MHPPRRHGAPTVYRRPNPLIIQSADDRRAFRLLLLPLVLLALAIAVVPALHHFPTLKDVIAATPQVPVTVLTQVADLAATAPTDTAVEIADTAAGQSSLPPPAPLQPPTFTTRLVPPVAPVANGTALLAALPAAQGEVAERHRQLATRAPSPYALSTLSGPASELQPTAAEFASATENRSSVAILATDAAGLVALSTPDFQTARGADQQVALMIPPSAPTALMALPPRPYETNCPITYASATPPAEVTDEPESSAPFGTRLAQAAETQIKNFVIYDDKYRQISRIGGDVPALYGVCTDVVVRAYRAVGIDLQVLVQASRLGAGDPNIDHRRTETLRRFLARFGESLPTTPFGEDYQPGDIVTYWRPQNSGSKSHIAVVAATLGPSGNPMIIHNRGWGPQMEDGLFVDRLTGHYRYDGTNRPPMPQMAASRARPFPLVSPALPIAMPASERETPQKPNGL